MLSLLTNIYNGDWLKITRPPPPDGDGNVIYVRIINTNHGGGGTSNNPANTQTLLHSDTFGVDVIDNHRSKIALNWHNCYSFGNGVESNRIADTFNAPYVTPGVKVSTIFEDYKEEHRKYGLIYSGLYNVTSGINNLNQFIQAEKITKDINPTYGSIQKLHARDTDLITLCEDKVLRILANKDALYNADGNPQLTATDRVLGQAVPFIGEFGISKNPESFASESYRAYFTDKQRGAVMRLSRDGLTPISMHGMRDWFRDNLSTSRVNLLGENNLDHGFHNWDIPGAANLRIANGVATLGYFNNDIESDKYGLSAKLRKNGVLEVGKKYRFQYDTLVHSGLKREITLSSLGGPIPMVQEYPTVTLSHGVYVEGSGTAAWNAVNARNWRSYLDNFHVTVEFIAASTDIEINQLHVNSASPVGFYTPPNSAMQTIESWVEEQRMGYPSWHNPYVYGGNYLFGSVVKITNLVLEEVKVEPRIIGSYDDRQEEYNVTIHSAEPKTISFREDVTGWVSFKSFFPENAISCANDYYTMKGGKLWQHHVIGANHNTFYDKQINSKINVILNDSYGSVKSFHTLGYEGSQSRIEGVRTVIVTGIEHKSGSGNDGKYFFFEMDEMDYLLVGRPGIIKIKQYRDDMLIYNGFIKWWDNNNANSQGWPAGSRSGGPTKGHGRRDNGYGGAGGVAWPGDFEVDDIITTEFQEKSVGPFGSTSKDGWFVSSITTDKQNLHNNSQGSLPEFIEKEGKWFNYIKGVDSNIGETTDFGSFDIQGIGIVSDINTLSGVDNYKIFFDNNINSSLQINDILYYETPTEELGSNIVNMSENTSMDYGFQVMGLSEASWDGNYHLVDNPINYMTGITPGIVADKTYRLTLRVKNYSGGGDLGVSNTGGVSGNAVMAGTGVYIEDFVSDGTSLDIFGRMNDQAEIVLLVQEVGTGGGFGFTRLESENIQKCGTVTDFTNNTITINTTGVTPPPLRGYVLFVKNQVVNTSGLLGYYADIRLQNNSIGKSEIFNISSEVTESSK